MGGCRHRVSPGARPVLARLRHIAAVLSPVFAYVGVCESADTRRLTVRNSVCRPCSGRPRCSAGRCGAGNRPLPSVCNRDLATTGSPVRVPSTSRSIGSSRRLSCIGRTRRIGLEGGRGLHPQSHCASHARHDAVCSSVSEGCGWPPSSLPSTLWSTLSLVRARAYGSNPPPVVSIR